MLGLTVLVLVGARLIAKLVSPTPLINSSIPHWQDRTAKVVQTLLCALMVAMPVLGWLMLSASGNVIPFYGLELPTLTAKNKELADTIKEIHEVGATATYVLVGIHAAAAPYHHYFLRDNTLRRMLP